MKECPRCGKKFNWLQSVVGEYKEHLKLCKERPKHKDQASLSTGCRGCPAGCYERVDENRFR